MERQEEEKPFEYYMKERDNVISDMEDGKIEQLDSLIERYEYGSVLIEKCNKILKDAELRINKITQQIQQKARETNG
jgi:exodeoxyribonuclease VII small subunit